MKKKFFGLIFAFALMFTGTVCLTACGDKPFFQGLVIEENGQTIESNSYYLGAFPVDSTQQILDYKVYAKYSDNTKTELSASDLTFKYSFNGDEVSELPSVFDEVGAWHIEITYDFYTQDLNFDIVLKKTNYSIVGLTNIKYPANAHALTLNDATAKDYVDFYYIEQSKVANANSPTDEELADASYYSVGYTIKPGNYYVYGNVRDHGKFAAGRTALRELIVSKGDLKIEGYNQADYSAFKYKFGEGFYDPEPTLLGVRFSSTNPNVDGEWIANVRIEATILGMPAPSEEDLNNNSYGKLSLGFKFKNENNILSYAVYGEGKSEELGLDFDDYKDFYNIPEGWDSWDATVTVERGMLAKPSINGGVFEEPNKLQLSTQDSDKPITAIEITKKKDGVLQSDFAPMQEPNGSAWWIWLDELTEAGTYTYTVSLKDKDNFAWEDGSTDDIVLTWIVE